MSDKRGSGHWKPHDSGDSDVRQERRDSGKVQINEDKKSTVIRDGDSVYNNISNSFKPPRPSGDKR